MPSSSAIKMLQELAIRHLDLATEKLALANKNIRAAQDSLALLSGYRNDYIARYTVALNQGLSIQTLTNYQRFIQKLDHAIVGQEHTIGNLELVAKEHQIAWQEQQKKKMSYGVLMKRSQQKEQVLEGKRDQKMMDEFASRAKKTVQNKTGA